VIEQITVLEYILRGGSTLQSLIESLEALQEEEKELEEKLEVCYIIFYSYIFLFFSLNCRQLQIMKKWQIMQKNYVN
jgi:hypothetical protein